MWETLRTFVNRVGNVYDELKTSIVFAEDMNKIASNLSYLKNILDNLPDIPTNTSDLTNDSGFLNSSGVESLMDDNTLTFSNKRINARIVSSASYTTDTGTALDVSTCDEFVVTAQAGALKFNNPSGTPLQGQKLIIRIKDNGTARALTYDTQFRAIGITLPNTTVINKTLYIGCIYNATDTKWDVVAVAQEA